MPGISRLLRSRLFLIVGILGLVFGAISFAVTYWPAALGLKNVSLMLAGVMGAAAVGLTAAGAAAIVWAMRPLEAQLRRDHASATRARAELEAVIAASPLAIVTVDAAGLVTDLWNPAAERLFGWQRAEVVGRPVPFIAPEQRGEFERLHGMALAGEPVVNVPIRRQRKDGAAVDLSLSTARLPGADGEPDEVVAIISDISREVAARGTLEFQAAIIASVADPIVAYDFENRVTYWNKAAEELFGWTAEEMLGTYANDRLQMKPVGSTLYGVRKAIVETGGYSGELRIHRRDGTAVHVESRCTRLREADGRIVGYVCVTRDLTARRRVEAELAESRRQFARLSENVPDVVFRFRLRPAPGFEYVSPAVTGLSGYSPEEIYADPELAVRAMHAEDRTRLLSAVADPATVSREPFVFRFHRPDGSLLWAEIRLTPVRDEAGEIVAVEGVGRDVGDRVAAEQRLRESEERYRRLAENAPDIIYRYRVRPQRGFEFVSPGVAALSGYALEEFYADPDMALRLLPPEHHGVIETLGTRPEELEGRTLLLPWRRKDGRQVWVEQRNVLVRDTEGRVIAFEGIARDVTDRMEMEERNARLTQVVEQTAEIVLVTDTQGVIVYVNPAFERHTGYPAAEMLGQTPRVLKSGLQSDEFYHDLWRTLQRGETWAGRMRNRRKDGSLYTVDAMISPVRDRAGTVINYVGIQRDITRESELDDQLRQAQKMEAVGQLTGGIAHDFNNLLTVVLANLSLLRAELGEVPGAVAHSLDDIHNAARRGSEMVRKLLAFGRQERLQPRPADLPHLVVEFVRTVGRVLPESIRFHVGTAEALPAALADPGAVEQVLLNLATNARDAMPDGGAIEIRFAVATFDRHGERTVSGWREPGRFVQLTFRDTGTGMEESHLERIFEPFFTTKPTGKGTGLGMPMVYGLMKQQQGFVTVDSQPGAGTAVHLFFPVAEVSAVREQPPQSDTLPRGSETILLVEDEEPIRRVARRVLEQLGYIVVEAGDGEAGLEAFREHGAAIDLVLTDVVMPGLNGPDFVAALRAKGHQVPVLFATGYASTDVLPDRSGNGDVMFIEKPWTVDGLARRVREALERG